VPILSILTIFILPLKMYWDTELYANMIYDTVTEIQFATDMLVRGRAGNVDVCKLQNLTQEISVLLPKVDLRASTAHLRDNPYYVSLLLAQFRCRSSSTDSLSLSGSSIRNVSFPSFLIPICHLTS
jgi:hypothetical protein